MIKGLYSSSNGMPPMLVKMEVLANNLANMNATGFKKDGMFVEMMKDSGVAPKSSAGEFTARLTIQKTTDFSEGSLKQTQNPLDFALQGEGYFVVQTPQGERYTRNGNFTLGLDGSLTTREGFPVLSSDGKITLPNVQRVVQENVVVTESGEIMIGKDHIGKIRIVEFQDQSKLKKEGGAIFRSDEENTAGLIEKEFPIVRQGFLEESNVDGIAEMIEMIEISRHFESNQKAITSQDATLDKLMEVGKF
ncbi:MAG: flagellar basal-body rod protein FlgF [Bacteroidetes bacterium]|nr:flagellar basal-body rod protein FlgF [Bacteroidota bacterium]MCW5895089.1 flagellar basal-body rod protein FlgF [Bacteroidota bacterium]